MNTSNEKQKYSRPQIERVQLDNEISLVLMSGEGDPGEPGAINSTVPEYFNRNPYNRNLA